MKNPKYMLLGSVVMLGVLACGSTTALTPSVTQTHSLTKTQIPLTTPTATSSPTVTAVPTSTPPRPPEAASIGDTWVSPGDGMILAYVPAGEFLMGSDGSTKPDDRPEHTVYLDAFWIDQTEVTNAMFSKFVSDTGYRTDAEKAGWAYVDVNSNWTEVDGADWQHPKGPDSSVQGLENHPVVQVSWNDATAYCEWVGRRLPTEAEWEKAARGTDGRTYPWGEGIDCNRANYLGCVGGTSEAGSYPDGASPYGALDMAGNVWEWVSDWNDETYYQNSPVKNPQGPDSGFSRGMRGGSWEIFPFFVQAYVRYSYTPDGAFDFVGFRCAVSP